MKIINTEELLKLDNANRAKTIRQIILGEIKFVGGNTNEKKQSERYSL